MPYDNNNQGRILKHTEPERILNPLFGQNRSPMLLPTGFNECTTKYKESQKPDNVNCASCFSDIVELKNWLNMTNNAKSDSMQCK